MTLSVSIRPAVPADIPSLTSMFEALDEQHRIALPKVFREPPAGQEQSWFDRINARTDRVILVAEGVDKKSSVSLQDQSRRTSSAILEIDQLVVGVGERRSGVGRSLLQAPETWAREQGISELEVSAWSFNVEAIEVYHKLGFDEQLAEIPE